MKITKFLLFFFFFINTHLYASQQFFSNSNPQILSPTQMFSSKAELCNAAKTATKSYYNNSPNMNFDLSVEDEVCRVGNTANFYISSQLSCPSATSVDLKVPTNSGSYVCTNQCQYKLRACVDVDFESGMTCSAISTGQDCGTPKPVESSTSPPVTQDPTNPTDKTEDQAIFENIMNVIGDKLDSIKDAITGGNQNQNGGNTGGSNGGTTGGDVTVNVDMSETNAKIDETNSLIDELTKWLQGEDLGDDIFGDSEPPEKELTPQQLDTNIFSGRAQCPADARLSFNLLGGKTFTKTFEFKDWCDNLEIFGFFILIASYLFGAYIIVSKS